MISVSSLTKRYHGETVYALEGVSFEIGSGEAVVIVGPSGSGKTTLLQLLGALDFPTAGRIVFEGRVLAEYRPFYKYRARHVGFVFQFHHLIPTLSLLDNVAAPMLALSVKKKDRKRRAQELLAAVGLHDRMHSFPARVSGGERQRGAIARALANEPGLILADEPTGNLDSVTGERVMGYLFKHCRLHSVTLIVATHNASIVSQADRVIELKDGRMVSDPKA